MSKRKRARSQLVTDRSHVNVTASHVSDPPRSHDRSSETTRNELLVLFFVCMCGLCAAFFFGYTKQDCIVTNRTIRQSTTLEPLDCFLTDKCYYDACKDVKNQYEKCCMTKSYDRGFHHYVHQCTMDYLYHTRLYIDAEYNNTSLQVETVFTRRDKYTPEADQHPQIGDKYKCYYARAWGLTRELTK